MKAYTKKEQDDFFDYVFGQMTMGRSISSILKNDENMPAPSQFYKWLRESEEHQNNYARANEARADAMFEQMKDIVDNPQKGTIVDIEYDEDGKQIGMKEKQADMTQHRRLQADTYKWMLGRMKPKKYGDKIDVTSGDKPLGNAIAVTIVPPKDDDD